MKILHIVESLELGGLERMVMDLAKWQSQDGAHVDILSLSENNPLFDLLLHKEKLSLIVQAKKQSFDWKLIAEIYKLIKRNNYNIIHTHNAMANYYACFSKILLGKKIKLINTRHGMGDIYTTSRKEKIYKVSVYFTDEVVFVTSAAQEIFIQKGLVNKSKSSVIINGVLQRQEQNNKLKREQLFHQTNKDTIIIGTVARLNPVKNQVFQLQILKELTNVSKNDFRLLIVGDGPSRNKLETYTKRHGLSQKVYFSGNQENVGDYLGLMDVFILTSLSEGVPLTILEAMAHSKLIITTPVGGIPEIIRDKINGRFIPLDDPPMAAAIIDKTIADEELVKKLCLNSKNDYQNKYTLQMMANKYKKLYNGI